MVTAAVDPLDHEGLLGLVVRGLPRAVWCFAETADLLQAGRLGLVVAAREWDPSRGAFSTFAYTVVRRRVLQEARRAALVGPRHGPFSRWLALSLRHAPYALLPGEPAPDPSPGPLEQAARRDEQEYARGQIRRLLRLLTPRRRLALEHQLAGLNLRQSAAEMGVTRERVRQLRTGAVRKLQDFLCPDDGGRVRRPPPRGGLAPALAEMRRFFASWPAP